ncbi:MAG TPA: hypothetical protein PKD53_17335 [Chloroflexaceae bacterium]|mgnify:CR=1 FL=1|nr:hypothetical protein [Chloroflexaceae bacterium]
MSELTLTIIDTIGIQDYIFASNRLRENLGASELVERAVREWVWKALPTPNNVEPSGAILDERRIEADATLQAELLLQGGGNAVVLFRTRELAVAMVGRLSRRLLSHAPGLSIAVAHIPFTWDAALGGEGGALDTLYKTLARAKQVRPVGAPLLGQSVTLECRSTGLPAVAYARAQGDDDDEERPASADVLSRIDPEVIEGARRRLAAILPPAVMDRYALPDRFDDLGRSEGVQSYLAVVHADGNGVGERFTRLTLGRTDNRAQITALRTLSRRVDEAGKLALSRTIATMVAAFESPERRDPENPLQMFLAGLPADRATGKPFLPFRPIVYGGDDVTFVCDGRLGLALAAEYLRQFHKATEEVGLPDGEATEGVRPAHACAGVAIVKTHYPFARAYELAEELCQGAKSALRATGRIKTESALDWHFALSGLLADLETIREREYTADTGQPLVTRPLTRFGAGLGPNWRTWAAFEQLVTTLQTDAGWRERRNKVKELREVLRRGPDRVKGFLHAFRIDRLPALDGGAPALSKTGWESDTCGYFDAIEALDFYVQLS